MEVVTVILINLGALGSAFYRSLSPVTYHASWMRNIFVAVFSGLVGSIAGFFVIYLCVKNYGWFDGLLLWVFSSIGIAIFIQWTKMVFPIVFGTSQILMVIGFFLWFMSFDSYKNWESCGENAISVAEDECRAEGGDKAVAFCFGAGGRGVVDTTILACGYEPLTSTGAVRTESCDRIYYDLYLECISNAPEYEGDYGFPTFGEYIYDYINPDVFNEKRLKNLCLHSKVMSREDLGKVVCNEHL